jgi:hypothetical protein
MHWLETDEPDEPDEPDRTGRYVRPYPARYSSASRSFPGHRQTWADPTRKRRFPLFA